MEAGQATVERSRTRMPAWLAGLLPLAVLGVAIGLFVALGAPGLDRNGVPVEEIAVERTVLRPGEIELTVRNDGPDDVAIAQVLVNDAFVRFEQTAEDVGRLGGDTLTVQYPWIEGEAYAVALLTSTGTTFEHEIGAAAETPSADAGFYGLMGLIGLYVGIIPVAIGMLWLPWVRRIDPRWVQFVLALTIGLLAWLGLDALLEGTELAGAGAQAFGGAALVFLGAGLAYFGLAAVDSHMRAREERARASGQSAWRLALLVALGIGLHNLGEGLAIGSAYAVGELALGAFLVFGFALHNTTEGLAIAAPLSRHRRPSLGRLAALGLIAGAPAILGAFIGASAFNPELAALLIGVGIGAIVQVIVQLVPAIRDGAGRALYPASVGGILTGVLVLYVTGLLISA